MNVNQDQLFSALKKDVRSLLVSAKFGVAPEQLKRDYQALLGYPLPLRTLGFRHVLDMVKEMPDVVYVDYEQDGSMRLKAVVDETTRGIQQLVAKQRTPKGKPASGRTFGSFGFGRQHYPQGNSIIMPRRVTGPPPLPAHLRSQLRQLLSQGPLRLSELEQRYALRFGRRLQPECFGYYSLAELLAASADLIAIVQSRSGSLLKLKTCITPLRPLTPHQNTEAPKQHASSTTNRLSPHSVLKESQPQTENKDHIIKPPVSEVPAGTNSDKQDAESKVDRQSFEKSILKLEEQLRQQILEFGDAGTVSPELKAKLHQIVTENINGIALHQLPLVYKKMFGEDLPLAESGFVNVSELVGALSDVLCVQPDSKEDKSHLVVTQASDTAEQGHYLNSEDSHWDGTAEEDTADDLPINAEQKVDKTIQQVLEQVPVDSVVPLDAVKNQRLKAPTLRKERELLSVLVEHVESPGHFYVRFEGQESRMLEDMMLQMRTFYACPEMSQRYRLLDGYVRPGQVCCVAPRDIWFYRVVILQVLDSQQVEVYYTDFGDVNTVDRDRLCFLKACYATLPAQAVPSSLSGIKPVGVCWTANAIGCFQKLCCDRLLVAAIDRYRGGFMQVYLCDTHTHEDLYVHSILQTEGHAVSCSKADYLETSCKSNPVSMYLGDGELKPVKTPESAVEETHVTSATPVTSDPESIHPVAEAKVSMEESTSLPNIPALESAPPPDIPVLESAPPPDIPVLESAPPPVIPALESAPMPDIPVLESVPCSDVLNLESTSLPNVPLDETAQPKVNPFEALLSKDILISSDWDQGWNPNRNSSAEKHVPEIANHDSIPKHESLPRPVPVVESCPVEVSSPRRETLPQDPTPPALSRIHTRDLKPEQICRTGVEPSTPIVPGLIFPMISPGGRISPDKLFLHHASPLALRPATRMAAGLHFLKW
ncbi:tudor domain-containing protein 5 [Alosa sapidissima]|uniref:tudor domain-containing protein 5 n=1 Tax=Alosa sapidissima TaxID=34773 RepID=UPI001C0A601B|nr:tudor domain-containing protein 5 [Alosa sapidissima]XP_041912088.1 tudor domain-containing protein 5 [Alosa sapidissima]XP_041912089.1 tudor domain-containing protein 5 [Alosa sapidissima]XP_041912090.1 tudor domain-containing protein 5 [Alosa sapidissima]